MICEVCNKRPGIGVACIPGMPMSCAWCEQCLASGAIPYAALVANTACLGGPQYAAPWWDELIETTLNYLNISRVDFHLEVWESVRTIEDPCAMVGHDWKFDPGDDSVGMGSCWFCNECGEIDTEREPPSDEPDPPLWP